MTTSTNGIYLERYAYPVEFLNQYAPDTSTGLIVTIPCYNEDNLISSLQSLNDCFYPGCSVEVIIIINHPENCPANIKAKNFRTYNEAESWIAEMKNRWLKFYVIKAFDLPAKSAGVGLARKIGMDEAVRRFAHVKNKTGLISCFDSDCLCQPNYFQALINYFKKNTKCNGATVYFEHPLSGDLPTDIYKGITQYELHLRYLTHALRYSGFPFTYYTVGSTIVVPVEVYKKQGGMNARQAGEDFYFIQKIASLGNFHEIKNTVIFPSPRVSDRVPFGTGKAMKRWTQQRSDSYFTYNYLTFTDLKQFIEIINLSYENQTPEKFLSESQIPETINMYLNRENWQNRLLSCLKTSNSLKVYNSKVYNWFNGLKVIRYLNYSGSSYYEDLPVEKASRWLLKSHFNINSNHKSARELLNIYRKIDREIKN